jgi:hypothetical protein
MPPASAGPTDGRRLVLGRLDLSTPLADLRSAARELSISDWARLPKAELVKAILEVDRR